MDQVRKFLSKFYRGVATPLAVTCEGLSESGKWKELQELSIGTPSSYLTAWSYKWDAAVIDLTRKLLLPGDNEKRRAAAEEIFWACEAQCSLTNARLDRFVGNQGPFTGPSDILVSDFISRWRKNIKRVLGRSPYILEPAFSGGSTLSDAGKLTTIPDKMSSVPTGYAGFDHIAHDSIRFTPLGEQAMVLERGNTFFTVPKDSQKDRGCCIEASVAISLQLAVGKLLKRLYRKAYKVDLRHAQPLHRQLARDASAGLLRLVTIDLSNASDTVARKLVKLLLPEDWFMLLNSLRAPSTLIGEKQVFLEKFSSMGNGFTFELETLLFRTLCETVNSNQESYVYGDDIIHPTDTHADLLAALAFFGFTPNVKKTFCEGPFRESCGGDYFNGVPVRAHFMKEIPDEPQKWMSLANGVRRLDPELDMLHAAWRFCVDQVPQQLRVFGPENLGDLVIFDPEAQPKWRSHKVDCYVGNGNKRKLKRVACSPTYFWRIYRPVSRQFDLGKYWGYRAATAAASLRTPSQVSPRDSITGYKLDWVAAYGLQDHTWWCGS